MKMVMKASLLIRNICKWVCTGEIKRWNSINNDLFLLRAYLEKITGNYNYTETK
jgi:hypothetical protein